MKRILIAAALALALAGCTTSAPKADNDHGSSIKIPDGFQFADMYIGGAWVQKPAKVLDGCTLPSDAYCWSTEITHDTGCAKGFAFTWKATDAYGDQIMSGRERMLRVKKNEVIHYGFRIIHSNVDEVTVENAACI